MGRVGGNQCNCVETCTRPGFCFVCGEPFKCGEESKVLYNTKAASICANCLARTRGTYRTGGERFVFKCFNCLSFSFVKQAKALGNLLKLDSIECPYWEIKEEFCHIILTPYCINCAVPKSWDKTITIH